VSQNGTDRKEQTMRKLAVLTLFVAAIAVLFALPAAAKPRGTNGKIVVNADNSVTGQEQVYAVDPDGTDLQLLANDTEAGQWSPNGTRIAIFGGLLNFDNGSFTDLSLGTLYPDLFLGCGTFSPDGARLACEGLDFSDPSGDRTGVYTIRSSDGRDLQRVTSNPGGDDCQGDYAPNGRQIVFLRNAYPDVFALFVVKLDGSGLRQITPSGMDLNFDCGNWSPQGNEILLSAHVPNGFYRSTVWVVHSDGSGLRQVPIPGCGGLGSSPTSISCRYSSWSPDGKKILFSRFSAATGQRDLYTVNPDGRELRQVTNTPGIDEFFSDWGTHPTTP
jgi:Tol biopolymer transport system component